MDLNRSLHNSLKGHPKPASREQDKTKSENDIEICRRITGSWKYPVQPRVSILARAKYWEFNLFAAHIDVKLEGGKKKAYHKASYE